jgi:hypothetical protein
MKSLNPFFGSSSVFGISHERDRTLQRTQDRFRDIYQGKATYNSVMVNQGFLTDKIVRFMHNLNRTFLEVCFLLVVIFLCGS